MFVPGKLLKPVLTNTITTKKVFKTFASGISVTNLFLLVTDTLDYYENS